MTEKIEIYAPNIHLFAFHLYDSKNSDLLWQYYIDKIEPKFSLSPQLKFKPGQENQKSFLWKDANASQTLLFFKGSIEQKIDITGCVCPLLIYDSYGLALNLRIPEKQTDPVSLDIFRKFNRDRCFCPETIQSDLGQTILLTAKLLPEQRDRKEEWSNIAANILCNFLNLENITDLPPLYQAGQLFEHPIYEYGSPKYTNSKGKIEHYIIWLFIDDSTDTNFVNSYYEFIDLFLYRNKTTSAYQESRREYQSLKHKYQEVKTAFQEIAKQLPNSQQSDCLSDETLKNFNQKLRQLPKLDLEYTDCLSYLKKWHLTININLHNYKEKLAKIQERNYQSDFTFLAIFSDKVALTLQNQIADDLGYFDRGSHLVDKAIATIRGLVEIDQAQRDRNQEKLDKERDRDLQILLTAIGAGLGVAGVTATAYPYYKEQKPTEYQLTPPFTSPQLHPITESILVSLGLGVLTFALFCLPLVYFWLKKRSRSEYNLKR